MEVGRLFNKAEAYIGDMTFEDFTRDSKTSDAVIRNLEIIGEASRHIPDEIRKQYSGIDWQGIAGFRNRIVHEYFGVSLKIVWTIAKEELPALLPQIEDILIREIG